MLLKTWTTLIPNFAGRNWKFFAPIPPLFASSSIVCTKAEYWKEEKQRGPWSAVITRDDRYSNSMHLERDDEKSENGDNPFLFADLSVRVVYSRRKYERGDDEQYERGWTSFFLFVIFSRVVLDDWVENKRVRDEIDPKKYKIFTIKINFRLTI